MRRNAPACRVRLSNSAWRLNQLPGNAGVLANGEGLAQRSSWWFIVARWLSRPARFHGWISVRGATKRRKQEGAERFQIQLAGTSADGALYLLASRKRRTGELVHALWGRETHNVGHNCVRFSLSCSFDRTGSCNYSVRGYLSAGYRYVRPCGLAAIERGGRCWRFATEPGLCGGSETRKVSAACVQYTLRRRSWSFASSRLACLGRTDRIDRGRAYFLFKMQISRECTAFGVAQTRSRSKRSPRNTWEMLVATNERLARCT